MTIAGGIAKQLRVKRETVWNTAAGTTGGVLMRRVQSTLDLKKAIYQSNEIRSDRQAADSRHGVRSVDGNIQGELSCGTYADFFAAALRQEFATGVNTGSQTTISASATAPQFARSAGSFLTDGFKIGDVIRAAGFATTGVPMNARNFLVTAVTTTGLTGFFLDKTVAVAKAAGDSVTISVFGKKTLVPQTGHTDISYSIEHFYADITQSELLTGCKLASIALSLPATGMVTVTFTILGADGQTTTSAYYTSPAASSTGGVLASVNGALLIAGSPYSFVTGLTLTIDLGLTSDPVVGSNTVSGIVTGRVIVTGQATVQFADTIIRDLFYNETDAALVIALTAGNTATSDFMTFNMPRVKYNGSSKDDGEKALIQTVPFQALLNTLGGAALATDLTTLAMQDSLA